MQLCFRRRQRRKKRAAIKSNAWQKVTRLDTLDGSPGLSLPSPFLLCEKIRTLWQFVCIGEIALSRFWKRRRRRRRRMHDYSKGCLEIAFSCQPLARINCRKDGSNTFPKNKKTWEKKYVLSTHLFIPITFKTLLRNLMKKFL